MMSFHIVVSNTLILLKCNPVLSASLNKILSSFFRSLLNICYVNDQVVPTKLSVVTAGVLGNVSDEGKHVYWWFLLINQVLTTVLVMLDF